MLETFQAMIGGRLAPLTIMSNEDTDIDSLVSELVLYAQSTTKDYIRAEQNFTITPS